MGRLQRDPQVNISWMHLRQKPLYKVLEQGPKDIIALSSAEAELHAASYGSMQTKGTQSVLRDLNVDMSLHVHTDASASIGVMKRQGLGKLRHIQVRDLWLQQELKDGNMYVHKVDTKINPADLATKPLTSEEMSTHIATLGMSWRT